MLMMFNEELGSWNPVSTDNLRIQ